MDSTIEIFGLLIVIVILQFGARWFSKTESGKQIDAKIKAKAKLPQWVQIAEGIIFFISFFLVLFILWNIVEFGWFAFYPSALTLGFNSSSRRVMLLGLAFAALPLSAMLANLIHWTIKPLRIIEIENYKDISNWSFKKENIGFLKLALMLDPLCLVLVIVGLCIK